MATQIRTPATNRSQHLLGFAYIYRIWEHDTEPPAVYYCCHPYVIIRRHLRWTLPCNILVCIGDRQHGGSVCIAGSLIN